MINDSTDIKKSSEAKAPIRKLYVVLGVIGVIAGVITATILASLNTPEATITKPYSSSLEVKPSSTPSVDLTQDASLSASPVEIVATDQTPTVEESTSAEAIQDCTAPEVEDSDKFVFELRPCEFTIFILNKNGDFVPENGSKEALQLFEDQSSVVNWVPAPKKGSPSAVAGPVETPRTNQGSSGSSSGSSGSSSSGAGTPAPAPSPAPTQTSICPQSRGENPAVYDACRAGFAMPAGVEYTGIQSCKADGSNYRVTFGLRLVGGSYGGVNWSGVSNSGGSNASITTTISGLSPDQLGDTMPIGSYHVSVYFSSMDGRYAGEIGAASFSGGVSDSLNACR